MNFPDYYEKFEKMQRWIISDLTNSTLKAKANFLVAMGIFNYIEMLGGFYHHDKRCEARFNYVIEDLLGSISQDYQDIFNKLKEITQDKEGAYGVLRCGMAHEYIVKTYPVKNENVEIQYTIYGVDDEAQYASVVMSKECGIEIISLEDNKYHIRIYNPRLIYDLNEAFEITKSRIRKIGNYRERFLKRCRRIHLEEFN